MPTFGQSETFFGETKSGIIELKDFRYPVFLYVPAAMKPGRRYPLLIVLPEEWQSPDKVVEEWKGFANRKTVLILAPTYKYMDDVPYDYDRWFFEMKSLIENQYPVNPKKVFLIGNKGNTSYAGYLAVNFPEEFSATAMVNGAWTGVFDKLLKLESRPLKQIPMFIALKEGQAEDLNETVKKAADFEKKNYPIEVRKYPEATDFTKVEFKKELVKWLDEKSENWQSVVAQNNKTWKEKVRKGIKDFFTV